MTIELSFMTLIFFIFFFLFQPSMLSGSEVLSQTANFMKTQGLSTSHIFGDDESGEFVRVSQKKNVKKKERSGNLEMLKEKMLKKKCLWDDLICQCTARMIKLKCNETPVCYARALNTLHAKFKSSCALWCQLLGWSWIEFLLCRSMCNRICRQIKQLASKSCQMQLVTFSLLNIACPQVLTVFPLWIFV